MAYVRRGSNHIEDIERGKALVEAAKNGNLILLTRLLESGVSVNADEYTKFLFYASNNYISPLQAAAAEGQAACLKVLIEFGADLNAKDRFDVTAVHMAAENGQYECLKMLLDAGADCCVSTKYSKKGCYTAVPFLGGSTPLHLASAKGHTSCIKELIQYGADYNAVDEKGRTSLYIAAERGLEDCILAHLHNAIGRDILSLPGSESGDTPLHFCVMHGLVRCVEELLKHGSDVNLRNCSGFSSLDYAVLYNIDTEAVAPEILKLMVLKGYNCDVNLPDYAGLTPLHYVSFSDGVRFRRRPELAAFLISCGSNFNICNQRGYTLIQAEMRQGLADLTILKAIIKSSLHVPSLSSLNLNAPPPPPPPQHHHQPVQLESLIFPQHHHEPVQLEPPIPPPAIELLMPNHNELAHHNYFNPRAAPFWNHNQNENPHLDYFGGGLDNNDGGGLYQFQLIRYPVFPGDVEPPGNNWAAAANPRRHGGVDQYNSRMISFKSKYDWYKDIASKPRSLQHYCRYSIRTSMGHKRLRHIKDLPIPISIQQYLLLEYDEYK